MTDLNVGYFRSPSIAGDRIVFLCEDDVWTIAAAGGVARRLTSNLGPVGRTIVSPRGGLIAFTARRKRTPSLRHCRGRGPGRPAHVSRANSQVRAGRATAASSS